MCNVLRSIVLFFFANCAVSLFANVTNRNYKWNLGMFPWKITGIHLIFEVGSLARNNSGSKIYFCEPYWDKWQNIIQWLHFNAVCDAWEQVCLSGNFSAPHPKQTTIWIWQYAQKNMLVFPFFFSHLDSRVQGFVFPISFD